jgi:hypothetical protein
MGPPGSRIHEVAYCCVLSVLWHGKLLRATWVVAMRCDAMLVGFEVFWSAWMMVGDAAMYSETPNPNERTTMMIHPF